MPLVKRIRDTSYGVAFTTNRLKGVWLEFLWDVRRSREYFIRTRLRQLSQQERVDIIKELEDPGSFPTGNVRLTFTVASRRLGNRDSNLARLLESLILLAKRPETCEVLVKIDEDDDLLHFLRVKQRFRSKIRIRIFVTPRLRGYADAHIFAEHLIRNALPCAKTWMVLTDDGVFVCPNWDEVLFAAIDAFPSEYYIGGELPFEDIVAIRGPWPKEPEPIYWYGSNPYHFASIKILNVIADVTRRFPGWTRYGSGFCFDTFFSAIAATVWEERGARIYLQERRIVERTGVFSFTFNERRNRVRSDALLDLMSKAHREKRLEIAEAIAKAADLPFIERKGEASRPPLD